MVEKEAEKRTKLRSSLVRRACVDSVSGHSSPELDRARRRGKSTVCFASPSSLHPVSNPFPRSDPFQMQAGACHCSALLHSDLISLPLSPPSVGFSQTCCSSNLLDRKQLSEGLCSGCSRCLEAWPLEALLPLSCIYQVTSALRPSWSFRLKRHLS